MRASAAMLAVVCLSVMPPHAAAQEAGAWVRAEQTNPPTDARTRAPRFFKKKPERKPSVTRLAEQRPSRRRALPAPGPGPRDRQGRDQYGVAARGPMAAKKLDSAWLEPVEAPLPRLEAVAAPADQAPLKPVLVRTLSFGPLGGMRPFTGAVVVRETPVIAPENIGVQPALPARPAARFADTPEGKAAIVALFAIFVATGFFTPRLSGFIRSCMGGHHGESRIVRARCGGVVSRTNRGVAAGTDRIPAAGVDAAAGGPAGAKLRLSANLYGRSGSIRGRA